MRQYSLKKDYSQDNIPWYVWLVFLGVLAISIFHFTLEQKIPVANAQTGIETKSDRQQETAYCKAWNKNQAQVSGATNMQIARHCATYLN